MSLDPGGLPRTPLGSYSPDSRPWRPDLSVHQNNPGTAHTAALSLGFVAGELWGAARDSAFLQVPRGWCCWSGVHTWGAGSPVQRLFSSPIWLPRAPQGWRSLPQLVAEVSDSHRGTEEPGAEVALPSVRASSRVSQNVLKLKARGIRTDL